MKKRASKLTAEKLLAKHQVALNTFVREGWGEIPTELEVPLKALKSWGFDLVRGLRGGAEAIFVTPTEKGYEPGDTFEERGEIFEVRELVKELGPKEKLFIEVTLEDRRGIIRGLRRTDVGDETVLFTLPAAQLLLAFLKKRGYGKLLEAFHSSGITSEFIQKNGEAGKAYPFEALPPKMRRALREAQDVIKKHGGVGRFTLVYFGENKDGEDRHVVTWLLPTIRLFDVSLAENMDKLLAALD
jgi:uncharacterized protein (TIGR00703 family)